MHYIQYVTRSAESRNAGGTRTKRRGIVLRGNRCNYLLENGLQAFSELTCFERTIFVKHYAASRNGTTGADRSPKRGMGRAYPPRGAVGGLACRALRGRGRRGRRSLGLAPLGHLQRAEDEQREDPEPDARQEHRDAGHDAEDGDPLSHVRHVQRGAERGLVDPEVADRVVDGLSGLGVLQRLGLVVRARAVSRRETRQLRVGLPAGRLERVDAHVRGEAPGAVAVVHRLVRDGAGREVDARVEAGLGRGLVDAGRRHVGRAGDLLLREVVVDRAAAVEAGGDRSDAEGDEHDGGEDSAQFQDLAHAGECRRAPEAGHPTNHPLVRGGKY